MTGIPAAGGGVRHGNPAPAPRRAARNSGTNSLLDLPESLLANILSRLPRKSLHDARLAARALDAASRAGLSAVGISQSTAWNHFGPWHAGNSAGEWWPKWARFPQLTSVELWDWRLVFEEGKWPHWTHGPAPTEVKDKREEGNRARQRTLLAACLPPAGGGGRITTPLAGVTRLCTVGCDLDLPAVEAALSATPNLRALQITGGELQLAAAGGKGTAAKPDGPSCGGAAAAAELIAARAPGLEALSAGGGALCERGAAALRSLPRLRALAFGGLGPACSAGISHLPYDSIGGAQRGGSDHNSTCYAFWEESFRQPQELDESEPPSCDAEAAWRQLPADQLRVLVAGALPAAPGLFDRWSSLVELWAVGLRADQLPSLAAGAPQLRLLSVRPRGPWDPATVAAACSGASSSAGVVLRNVVRAEFVACGDGFRSARPAAFLPAVETLQVGFTDAVLGEHIHDRRRGGNDDDDAGGGGSGARDWASLVDLSGLAQLRSLLVAGCGPLNAADWAHVGRMTGLARLACAVGAADLDWALYPVEPTTLREVFDNRQPPPAAALLARAAPRVEFLELLVPGGRGVQAAPLAAVARALPRLRSLGIAAGIFHAAPFEHPRLAALAILGREACYSGERKLKPLGRAPLRELFLPGHSPARHRRNPFSHDMWQNMAQWFGEAGIALRHSKEWAEPAEYECGWRPYRRWRDAGAPEGPGGAAGASA